MSQGQGGGGGGGREGNVAREVRYNLAEVRLPGSLNADRGKATRTCLRMRVSIEDESRGN